METKTNFKTKRSLLTFSFLPINMLTNWERASISANFFSNFLTITHSKFQNDKAYCNIISSMVNEIIEYSVKHSTFKNSKNTLQLSIDHQMLYLDINCNILKTHFYLLKVLLKDLHKNKNKSFLEDYNFYGEFSNFIFCIHSLINDYNASIKIQSQKSSVDPIKSVSLQLKFLLNEEDLHDN